MHPSLRPRLCPFDADAVMSDEHLGSTRGICLSLHASRESHPLSEVHTRKASGMQ